MEETHFVLDLVLVFTVALFGGLIARRLGQPEILGYIAAGILVGPNTPGYTADRDQVELLATIGVAFLMFALGVEFSLAELSRVRRLALIAGGIQIPVTALLGAAAGYVIGWSWQASLLLGGAFALSSSVLALTILLRRGDIDTPHGRATLGLMIVQDLALIPMIALLPVLPGDSDSPLRTLIVSLVIASAALVAVVVLGTRLVPRILYMVASVGSRELFLMSVVVIALGTAMAAEEAGLSLALGAFLAGIVVSESEFDRQVLSEIAPVRDLFATLFFVAVGMLLVPEVIFDNVLIVTGLIAALVVGKSIITGAAMFTAGADHRTAVLVATLVAQIGEFSFVLANEGLSQEVIDDHQYSLILSVAVGSIALTPFVNKMSSPLIDAAGHLPAVSDRERDLLTPAVAGPALANHVVICGFGRVGTVLGETLLRRGFSYSVIELNPAIVRRLQDEGIPAFYGDAGSETLLYHAGVERARVLVVATSDVLAAPAAIRNAKSINPHIRVIARAVATSDIEALKEAGADEIIQPEFEAGLESIRYVLRTYGVSLKEAMAVVNYRRARRYHDLEPVHEEALRPASSTKRSDHPDLDRA